MKATPRSSRRQAGLRQEHPGTRLALALSLAGLAAPTAPAAEPPRATVREYRQTLTTYPYSDPDPIANPERIYPYYRFDLFTDQPVEREWTVVELENAYLKLRILPEIGGKIWTAIEKSSGRAFLYDNQVVKFRDVAMRGPWTSGGIEANYGIIGHTPNCATPVDYVARTHSDGSASVVIGVLDLLTRTPWRLEVRLPADAAWFTTRSLWHNATPLEQPYYTWMNAAIKAEGNLQLVYPGSHFIGHGGDAHPWPIDPATGRDLSYYEQNDFGGPKSYHVLGREADFFAAWWHDDDFGMGRYSPRDQKLGKKAWIWGLSRQGMIWEDLLTDADGQYVEVQSGRLFNQAARASSRTPFKHRGFAPYATDTWTEHWFPILGTHGLVAASDLGGLNVRQGPGTVEVLFSPLQDVDVGLEILDGERVLLEERIVARTLQTWSRTFAIDVPRERLRVRIGGSRLAWSGDPGAGLLSRPLESPPDFDWDSVQGLYLAGKELIRQRDYGGAGKMLEACLAKDPHYLPALADAASLRYRAMDYAGAFELARRGLAVDTYDASANYQYGLAAERLGRLADARDGFQVAAQSPERRVAAWTELARFDLRGGELDGAAGHAARSLDAAPANLEAHRLLALVHRVAGRRDDAAAALDRLLELDPLNHFARFERSRLEATHASEREREFVDGVRNEMPHETFLELAVWYQDLGRPEEARRVLELAPPTAEGLYWRAWLADRAGEPGAAELLAAADAASPLLVFPFRAESATVLSWAQQHSASWRPRYYRALVLWSRGDLPAARRLLAECGEAPDYPPFYAARAAAFAGEAPESSLADLERAARLDPDEWRYGKALAERHLAGGRAERALEIARRYHERAPENYLVGMLHAEALLRSGRHDESAELLGRLRVIPFEGSSEGRRLYREAQLMRAVESLEAGRAETARERIADARLWPENLGAGRPYSADLDERLEDWLDAQALASLGRRDEAGSLLERLASDPRDGSAAGTLLGALAAKQLGREGEAERRLADRASREPRSPIAEWAAAVLRGEPGRLPEEAGVELRILDAWLASEAR